MSIQIHLRGPGLNMITRLKKEALNDLLRLLNEHRDDTAETPCWPEGQRGPRPMGARPEMPSPGKPSVEGKPARRGLATMPPAAKAIAAKLAAMTTAPLSDHPTLTFPEKLLLLGAWTEATKEKFILRGPVLVEAMVKAGQTPPANPKRDVMAAVQSGWFTLGLFPNPNRATLTSEGWLRVGEMLS